MFTTNYRKLQRYNSWPLVVLWYVHTAREISCRQRIWRAKAAHARLNSVIRVWIFSKVKRRHLGEHAHHHHPGHAINHTLARMQMCARTTVHSITNSPLSLLRGCARVKKQKNASQKFNFANAIIHIASFSLPSKFSVWELRNCKRQPDRLTYK